ncbi:MAG: hypothetical protein R2747_08230 [Pyrinomonadaceae bacterium]
MKTKMAKKIEKVSDLKEKSHHPSPITHHPNSSTLKDLPVGARLLYRAKSDWRCAVLSMIGEETATLIVCSPTGRTYRLRRAPEAEIIFDGRIPILKAESEEDWRENLTVYDIRW